jgi:hypothetical protein
VQNAYVVTGTMTDKRTIVLDETIPVISGRVRLIVEPEAAPPNAKRPYEEVMAEIRERQRLRGFQPRTKEEVDAYLQAERDSWDDD